MKKTSEAWVSKNCHRDDHWLCFSRVRCMCSCHFEDGDPRLGRSDSAPSRSTTTKKADK